MRLLIINQFFWPDTAPTGRFLLDVVRAVESSEIQITAICGESGYGTARTTLAASRGADTEAFRDTIF